MPQTGDAVPPAEMRVLVAKASAPSPAWTGPTNGPAGIPGKSIAIIAEDLRNGGILGVALGVNEAAKELQWQIKVFDAGGTSVGRNKAAAEAEAAHPDGVILLGADATEMAARLAPFTKRKTPIVGWHVGASAGVLSNGPVAVNVSTDPPEVARITAMAAVSDHSVKQGVVIFTDSNFKIAMAKADAMAKVVKDCSDCTLLEVCDVAISKCGERMPAVTRDLLARYGRRWTLGLAINDNYFDYAVPELTKAGRSTADLTLLSAGDGSASAFLRIQADLFQTATVAEPLNLQGWQLVDELNRLLAHQPANGYLAPVHLVTPGNTAYDGGPRLQYDPDNGYREIYRRIWRVK
ncbi:MAG TPA: substrate-binding domain-containing protein [Verrucomicrobiae bacterium]